MEGLQAESGETFNIQDGYGYVGLSHIRWRGWRREGGHGFTTYGLIRSELEWGKKDKYIRTTSFRSFRATFRCLSCDGHVHVPVPVCVPTCLPSHGYGAIFVFRLPLCTWPCSRAGWAIIDNQGEAIRLDESGCRAVMIDEC